MLPMNSTRQVWYCIAIGVALNANCVFAQKLSKEDAPTVGAPAVPVTRTAAGKILVGTNPTSDWDLFHLLGDPQIQVELQLSKEIVSRYETIAVTLKSERQECLKAVYKGELSREVSDQLLASQRIVASDSFRELLMPEQQKRLQQVAYRLELVRVGLAHAFTNGYLSIALGTYSNQESGIERKAVELDEQLRRDMRRLLKAAEDSLIAELTPDQAKRAHDLLGEPLSFFEERSEGQELFQSVLAKSKAQKEKSEK